MNEITKRTIDTYKNYLIEEEKSSVTCSQGHIIHCKKISFVWQTFSGTQV